MTPKMLLALDPGRTTGYAIGWIEGETLRVYYAQEKWTHLEFFEFLKQKPDHIVCESFEFRQMAHDGADLYPRELIGVLELAQQMFLASGCISYQMASVQSKKKAYFSDAKLKELGLYIRGLDHGRSAVKHLLHWVQFGPGAIYNVKEIRLDTNYS